MDGAGGLAKPASQMSESAALLPLPQFVQVLDEPLKPLRFHRHA